ncbi:MAG: tetratricopeptide repeat protein [Candidatus Xenobia bacterium]
MERFTPRQVQDILHLSASQLAYWKRLKLVAPEDGTYSLQDLISMRTILRLRQQKVPLARLRQGLQELSRDEALATKKPLIELRLRSVAGQVVHHQDGGLMELITGQMVLDLDGDGGGEKVRVLRQPTADEWLAAAVRGEADGQLKEAQHAYEQALKIDPDLLSANINLGTLHFKLSRFEEAEALYRRALALDPFHPVVRFNLANVLDEQGKPKDALPHLEEAVRMAPDYGDARFNLALLLEKLGRAPLARVHWLEYLRVDSESEWADLARRHLSPYPEAPRKSGPRRTKVVPLRRRV